METRKLVRTSAGLVVTAIACLMTGERNENLSERWNAINGRQEAFLRVGAGYRAIVLTGNLPIETVFSGDSAVVNEFLRERGMTIKVSPCGPLERAFAAVMKIEVNWPIAGEEGAINIHGSDRNVVGVHIDVNYLDGGNMTFHRAVGHDHTVVRLRTKEGDTVVLTRAPESTIGLDGAELFEQGIALMRDLTDEQPADGEPRHDGVMFPKSVFDVEFDLSYLIGLWTTQKETDRRFTIVEAKGQVKGELTKLGAKVIEAVAMKGTFECLIEPSEPNPVIIDREFLMIVERDGVPISVLLIGDDSWETVTATKSEDFSLAGGDGSPEVEGAWVLE